MAAKKGQIIRKGIFSIATTQNEFNYYHIITSVGTLRLVFELVPSHLMWWFVF